MTLSWTPVLVVDVVGSLAMLLLSGWCAILSWQHIRKRPDDVFRNYLFLFTLAIVFFAVSRSFGHLVKQLLLITDHVVAWQQIAPYSGAVNSAIFVVIFAFGIYFQRFQTVHAEVEYYKQNLEDLIEIRTSELQQAKNTLENILNNTNPISITGVDFDLLQANDAYYTLWPLRGTGPARVKCYESRPGTHCRTDDCPLLQILEGKETVSHEVTKTVYGEAREFIAVSRPFRDVDGKLVGMVESFQDITRLKQAEKAMRESEERFRLIFAANPDPVILAKLETGQIIDVNLAFEAATGISRTDALGRNSEDLNLWEDPAAREVFRKKLQEQGEINNLEASYRVHSGEIKVGLSSARLLTINNEPCLLLVIRDITTEKAAEQALKETDRIKSEFISTAAHELNTPLTAMLGYSEFLLHPETFGEFSEVQKREFLAEIYERGQALSRIVDDLLDIGRIERGQSPSLELEETDLLDILQKKIRYFLVEGKAPEIQLELPEGVAHRNVRIDRHRINQVFDNLLSNAVKYSPENPRIVVRASEQQSGWQIQVMDNGIGMSPEQLARIFEKFYRVDATDTAISGLGLGMSVVKQIVEAHGGNIEIESALGKGTTVTFTLPFEPPKVSCQN